MAVVEVHDFCGVDDGSATDGEKCIWLKRFCGFYCDFQAVEAQEVSLTVQTC